MFLTTPALISRLSQNVESEYSLLPANRAVESQPFSQPLYKNLIYNHRALLQKKKRHRRNLHYICIRLSAVQRYIDIRPATASEYVVPQSRSVLPRYLMHTELCV